ncbi:unnamed protein product [Brassica oleracea var. botrytis]|uniref:(rape) hypothetical protein n=1 Tax=Brassica napus TaxID=3708 RepID=A0A816L380_BRANA|nr:unnamed protein product [Brassica napus]
MSKRPPLIVYKQNTGLHQGLCFFRLSSARESNLFEVITGRILRISLRHRTSILLV